MKHASTGNGRHGVRNGALSIGGLAILAGAPAAQFGQNPAEANERFGTALASGDFNADGVVDLAVGLRHDFSVGGGVNGAVQVFYGQLDVGPQVPQSVLWHPYLPGMPWGAGSPVGDGYGFGDALAAGDFDGDGYDDLAIGVPASSGFPTFYAGTVQVLFGSTSGLVLAGHQLWHQDVPGIGGKAEAYDRFGDSLASGDFNGDGVGDLAIGVPAEDIGVTALAGAVNVLYGEQGTGLTAAGDQLFYQGYKGVAAAPEPFDMFGTELAVGDFNDDGRDDLAIGVPLEDLGSPFQPWKDAGAVHVLYGSSTGLTGDDDGFFTPLSAGIPVSSPMTKNFGIGLAAGDFDGDGGSDLAVGSPRGYTSATNMGMVYVYYSAGAAGIIDSKVVIITQDTPGIGGTGEPFDEFGAELAAGDFNFDGVLDLAVGVPGEAIGSIASSGAVNVIYGILSSGLNAAGNQVLYQDAYSVEGVSQPGDRFGAVLAAGDFDGDSRCDLAVGVPQDNPGGIADAGAVNVLFSWGYPGLLAYDDVYLHQFIWEVQF